MKMNEKATRQKVNSYEGNSQDVKNIKQQFFELISMSFFGKDTFYESGSDQLKRLEYCLNSLVKKGQTDFICNAILYARSEMYMRSFPVAAAILFAKSLRINKVSNSNVRELIYRVIQRADQITDAYAYALKIFGDKRKVPMAIKKGVADSFNKFDEYQFGKYNRKNAVKFSDVLRITHPKPFSEDQGTIFERIIKGTLETPYTWETQLSKVGQQTDLTLAQKELAKQKVWAELVESGRLGYMALLRNLRNIEQLFPSNHKIMKLAALNIANEDNVRKSKQFPFRFANAMKNVSTNIFKVALSEAIEHSLDNLPDIGDNIVIIVDTSGSMTWGGHLDGSFTPSEMANLFGAAFTKKYSKDLNKDVCLIACASTAELINYNPTDSLFSIARDIKQTNVGAGTNLYTGLELAERYIKEPDAVIVLSDMQVTQFGSRRYSQSSHGYLKNAQKVAFNLAAYGSTPISELDNWYQVAGYSDKIFKFLDLRNNQDSIVKQLSQPFK